MSPTTAFKFYAISTQFDGVTWEIINKQGRSLLKLVQVSSYVQLLIKTKPSSLWDYHWLAHLAHAMIFYPWILSRIQGCRGFHVAVKFLSLSHITMAVEKVISERDSAGRTRRIYFDQKIMKVCAQMGKRQN